ncbi:MAG: UDP-2,4-diacetamido-2,4,6-trideoxy-beta-L-altropyranose hydrolase [Pseudomonadota bacterium]
MKVSIRADASSQIGIGHVMRCATLADALALRGATCRFLFRSLPDPVAEQIRARGHETRRLATLKDAQPDNDLYGTWLGVSRTQDAAECAAVLAEDPQDLLIVDHYAIDATWHKTVRPGMKRLLVVDDLADRPHDCDLLVDQNLGRSPEDYDGLVPDAADRMTGPSFAMLRPEFPAARDQALAGRNNRPFRRLLVSMGGMDKDDATSAILQELAHNTFPDTFEITVVMGPAATNLDRVRTIAETIPVPTRVLSNVADMVPLMAEADLAIGGAGSTSWERCTLGLPTLLLTIADNQWPAAKALEAAGAAVALGDIRRDGWKPALSDAVQGALKERCWVETRSRAAGNVCDGHGAERVADAVLRALAPQQQKGAFA